MNIEATELNTLRDYVEAAPWGDIDASSVGVLYTMELLLNATATDAERWWDVAARVGFIDEFDVDWCDLHWLTSEEKLAWHAVLLRVLARDLGIAAEPGQPAVVSDDPTALVPTLVQISRIATGQTSDEQRRAA